MVKEIGLFSHLGLSAVSHFNFFMKKEISLRFSFVIFFIFVLLFVCLFSYQEMEVIP